MAHGSLVVVGTGIRAVGHLTTEAIAWIRRADRVLYVVADPAAEAVIRELNPAGAESLAGLYAHGRRRAGAYRAMVERVLDCVRSGSLTCFAAYGHPGVFADATHAAIRAARQEGFSAQMLPAVSAEDCLFADLGVDPAAAGCQSFGATEFLLYRRAPDRCSAVVLWQVGLVGNWAYNRLRYDLSALPLLTEWLLRFYDESHPVYLYEAATLPGHPPLIVPLRLAQLARCTPSAQATLYIPPEVAAQPDPELVRRLAALRADSAPEARAKRRPVRLTGDRRREHDGRRA